MSRSLSLLSGGTRRCGVQGENRRGGLYQGAKDDNEIGHIPPIGEIKPAETEQLRQKTRRMGELRRQNTAVQTTHTTQTDERDHLFSGRSPYKRLQG